MVNFNASTYYFYFFFSSFFLLHSKFSIQVFAGERSSGVLQFKIATSIEGKVGRGVEGRVGYTALT